MRQQLTTPDGSPLMLHCINWFGFDNQQTMLDGLWAGTTALSKDFRAIAYRIQVPQHLLPDQKTGVIHRPCTGMQVMSCPPVHDRVQGSKPALHWFQRLFSAPKMHRCRSRLSIQNHMLAHCSRTSTGCCAPCGPVRIITSFSGLIAHTHVSV